MRQGSYLGEKREDGVTLKLYVSNSCSSCRKVKAFFNKLNIPYKEINILSGQLTKTDLKEILAKSDYGTEDLVSTRSKIMKDSNLDVDSMKLDDLLDFIVQNPTVMKRPIIVDERKIAVGYDPDEITAFLPTRMKQALDLYTDYPLETLCQNMIAYVPKPKKDREDHQGKQQPAVQLKGSLQSDL